MSNQNFDSYHPNFSQFYGLTPNLKEGATEMVGITYVIDGVPSGGSVMAKGIDITWQNGPLGSNGHNGAFVEDVIVAALTRLEAYQDSKFNCKENAAAIDGLKAAIAALQSRTANRTKRGVEGTHDV